MRQSKVLAEPIFVGREQELQKLMQLLECTIAGKGSTIFISGEAGSGKTRLLTEFLKITKNKDVTILTGWCLSDTPIPYFPVIEAFDSYLSVNEEDGVSAVNQKMGLKSWLLPTNKSEFIDKFVNNQPYLWKDQAFHRITKELFFLSAKKPLILIIDDIHWADSASLSLLHYLARQVSSERILILATFRREETRTDSKGQPNQLARVLLLMDREDLYEEIKLPNLGFDEIQRITESMLGDRVYPELVKKLTSDSGGIPLFVVESLRMLYQQRSLSKKDGKWSLCVENFRIPQKVRDIILQRLEALKLDQRKILDVASVVGEKFNPKLVASVISRDYAEVLISINKIAKTTLMVHCEGTQYKFNHIKFRELLYEEIPLLLKKEYHFRVAKEFEIANQSDSRISVTDLAYHFVKADNKIKAIKYSLQAGNVALSQFSNDEAIKHFSYVITSIKDDQTFIIEKLIALEGIGDSFLAKSMFRESMKVFEELGNLTENSDVRLRAFRKAMNSAFQLGDISHLMDLIEKAKPYAAANRLEYARILVSRGRAFHLRFMLSKATKDMEEALKIFEEEYSLWDVAWSLIGLGAYHAGAGKLQDGLAESLRSIAIFEELEDFQWQIEAYYVAGMTFNFCFLEQEALKMFAKVSEIDKKEKIGDYLRLVYANSFSSRSFESIGNFKKALTYSLKALKLSEKTDSLLAKGVVYSDLTRQSARLGRMNQTEKYFEKLMQIPSKILADPRTIIALAKPVFYASKNQWKRSNQHFREILEKYSLEVPEFILNIFRIYYVWALEKQELFDKAKFVLEENQKNRQKLESQFNQLNLRIDFMVPIRVKVDQKFEARLDIINVSRSFCYLNIIENLINPKLKLISVQPSHVLRNESIHLGKDILYPFQIKTIRVIFQAQYPGEINLNPRLIYADDSEKTMATNTKKIEILIEPTSFLSKIEFKSNYAQKAFDFLIKAFKNDYLQQKLPLEKSGWRTLMEIVKRGKVSKHSMYGRSGRGGKVVSELENLSLVESRFFVGERGRGGRILKVRVFYESENVKQYLD